jgi:lysophospholipase L1-like esterase
VTQERTRRPLSPARLAAFSVLAPVLLLGLLEFGLRFAVDPLPARTNTWFPDHIIALPLWHVNEIDDVQFLSPGQSAHFRPFGIPKPDKSYRIAVMGGSAAHGYGMLEAGAFPHRVEQLLQEAMPDREVQVLNLGTVAWSTQQLAWASQDLFEASEWDLLILYSGNNELLELSSWKSYKTVEEHRRYTKVLLWNQRFSGLRLYALLQPLLSGGEAIDQLRQGADPEPMAEPSMFEGDEQPRLGGEEERDAAEGRDPNLDPNVDPTQDPIPAIPAMGRDQMEAVPSDQRARMGELEATYAHHTYKHNVRRIIQRARDHGTPVLLMNPAPNDFQDPAWFPHTGPEGERYNELLDQATEIVRQEPNPVAAKPLIEEAVKLRPKDPRGLHLLGHFIAHKEPERARQLLDDARRLAEYPNRVVPAVTQAIHELQGEPGVVGVIDIEQRFREQSENGLIDYDRVYDHCHPSIEGNVVIAGEVVKFLMDRKPGIDSVQAVDVDAWVDELRQDLSERTEADDRVWQWTGLDWSKDVGGRYIADFQGDIRNLRQGLEDAASAPEATARDLLRVGNARFYDWEVDHALAAWQQAIRMEPSLCLAFANSAYGLKSVGLRERALKKAKMAAACDPADAEYAQMVTRLEAWTQ